MDEQQKALIKKILTASHWTEADKIRLRQILDQEDPELLRTVAFTLFHTDSETPPTLLSDEESTELLLDLRRKLVLEASKTTTISRLRVSTYYYIAALFIVALATALYFYRSNPIVHRKSTLVNEIGPGRNRATLTLADGTKVALDTAQKEIIVQNEEVKYNSGTLIVTRKSDIVNSQLLTLSTPKGGQYQVILEDGTKVWLNAASTLKYPSKFSGDKREVFLEGEAYFSVNYKASAGDRVPRVPFIVKTKKQSVTVLGTEFNVAAFADEKETKTTLVEGKVQVRSQNLKLKTYNLKLLQPNQQAVVKGDSLTVSKADVRRETAWRNGYFDFNHKNFGQVMRELARWYDLDVVYEGSIPNIQFYGDLNRSSNFAVVQALLESNKINYRLETGNKLIIMKKR
ncbi:FecR family protein [bacterium A37T11]|nr:FecR family protein [bacterium A37T11]